MSELYFKVGADYSEVQRLRQEVVLLQNQIRNFKPGQAGPSLNQLQSQLSDATKRMRQLTDAAARAGADIEGGIKKGVDGAVRAIYGLRNSLKDPLTATLSIAGVGALGGLLNQIASVRSNFQEMRTSIDVMLGSEIKGEKLMGQLTEFAKVSPLDFQGVVGAAKQMLGFNIEAKKVPEFLRAIGDVSMGDSMRFRQLTLAFSQMSAAGKLMGQDLMQMVNAGFQPLQIMAEKTGKSIGQLKDEMSKGKITSEMVQQAFLDATAAGGKYYQMSEKASQTIKGQMSMLGDAMDLLYNDLGQKAEGTIIKIIQGATTLIENYDKIVPSIGAVIATFGVYKASAMAVAYAEKVAQEDKSKAIREGFEKELEAMNKIQEKRRELARSENISGQQPTAPAIQKGTRYDSSKALDLQKELINPDILKAKSEIANIDGKIASENASMNARLKTMDDAIKARRDNLKQIANELESNDARLTVLNQEKKDYENRRMDYGFHQPEREKERVSIDSKMDDLAKQYDAEYKELEKVMTERSSVASGSQKIIEDLEKEKEGWISLSEVEDKLTASEGSLKSKKQQLQLFQDAYDSMTPSEQADDLGQRLHEQIEGLKADLAGIPNLDSDLADALSLGEKTQEEVVAIQNARNNLDDYISGMESEMERLDEVINTSSDVTEVNTATEQRNTIQKQLHEAQTTRDKLATDAESRSKLLNTGVTDANSAATTKNATVIGLATVKTKALTTWTHLKTKAIEMSTNAVNSLKAAWMSNPFGLILTGLTAVVSAFMAFKSTTEKVEEEQNANAMATLEMRNKIEGLYAVIQSANKNSQTYKNALDELKKSAKDYGLEIKDEIDAHQQLIEKKDRLIQLMIEEGRQKQIQANIDSYTQEMANAQDEYRKQLEKTIGGKHARTLAAIVVEDAQTNMDALLKLYAEYESKWAEGQYIMANRGKLSDEYRQYEQEMEQIQSRMENLLLSNAKVSAGHLGVELNSKKIVGDIDSMGIFLRTINETKDGLSEYTAALNGSVSAAEGLKDVTEKPISDMNVTELGKKMKEAFASAQALKDELKNTKSPKVDTSDVDKMIASLEKANKGTKDVGESSKDTSRDMDDLGNSASDAQDRVDELGNTTASPDVDSTKVDETKDKADSLNTALDKTDKANAKPTIDTTSIMNAISQLQFVNRLIQQANGQKVNSFYTPEEAKRMRELEAGFRKTANGKTVGAREDVAEYNKLVAKGRAMGTFQSGGKTIQLTPEEAQMFAYFRDENGNIKDRSTMSENDKKFFDQLTTSTLNRQNTADNKKNAKDIPALKKEIASKLTKATTDNQVDEVINLLKNIQTGDLDNKGDDYKWVQSMLKKANTKKGTYKSNKDPKMEQYNIDKENEKERKKEEEQLRKAENDRIDYEISTMLDGSGKEIKTIKQTAKKRREELVKERETEFERLKELDRQQWLKEQKRDGVENPKAYNWKPTKSDADYYAEADRRLDYAARLAQANDEEARGLKKVYDEDAEAMREYLIEYGTFEQQRAALAESYAEKIKKAKNEAERLRLEQEYNDKTINADRAAYTQMLKDFGSYQEKKLALQMEYDEKIKKASPVERATLTMQFQRDNESLDSEYGTKFAENGIDKGLFDYLDTLNIDVLDQLRTKLNALMQDSSASVEDLQEASQMLADVQGAISDRKSQWKNLNPFRNPNAEQERLEQNAANKQSLADVLQKKYQDEQSKLTNVTQELVRTLQSKGINVDAEQLQSGEANPMDFLSKFEGEEAKNFSNLAQSFSTQSMQTARAQESAEKAGQEAKNAGVAAAAGGGGGFAMTDAIIHGVNANMQSMPELLDKWGLGDTEFGRGMKDFTESSQYATQAFDSLKNGDIVGVISNLHSAFGSLGNVLGRLGIGGMGASDKNLESDIERLTESNVALRYAMNELADDLRDAKFSQSTDIYKMQKEDIETTLKNTQEMMSRSAANYSNGFLGIGGKKSSNHKINENMDASEWERISEITNTSVRSASDFFNLTSEQMADVAKRAPELYAKIKKYADDGYSDAAQYMDEYIELYKDLEEVENAYREKLTDVSFDNVKDEFKSTLLDMESSAGDFTNNFQKMMEQAVLNAKLSELFNDQIEDWYKTFSEYMESGNGLTVEEQNALREEWDRISKEALQMREDLKASMGWDSYYEQQSGAKTFTGMSQDQGMELNGRLTAIAVTAESIRQQNVTRDASLSGLNNNMLNILIANAGVLEQVTSVATTLAKTSIDIAEIRDNTFAVVKPIKELNTNIKEIKDSIRNL